MKFFISTFIAMTSALTSFAAIAQWKSGTDPARVFTFGDTSVTVPEGISLALPGKAKDLVLTGEGVRVKKVTFLNVPVNVYVAAHYVEKSAKFTPPADFKPEGTRAIELTFLRDVDKGKVRSSFEDSLTANGISGEESELKPLLDTVTVDYSQGARLRLWAETLVGGTEQVTVQLPDQSIKQFQGPHVSSRVWSIWFGIPADEGLKNLKADLLSRVAPRS